MNDPKISGIRIVGPDEKLIMKLQNADPGDTERTWKQVEAFFKDPKSRVLVCTDMELFVVDNRDQIEVRE